MKLAIAIDYIWFLTFLKNCSCKKSLAAFVHLNASLIGTCKCCGYESEAILVWFDLIKEEKYALFNLLAE